MSYLLVYITNSEYEKAQKLAHMLVENKLVACANLIDGVCSIYPWEGKVQQDKECIMICKTSLEKFDELEEFVKKNHPYDCPCIVSFEMKKANQQYCDWIEQTLN